MNSSALAIWVTYIPSCCMLIFLKQTPVTAKAKFSGRVNLQLSLNQWLCKVNKESNT